MGTSEASASATAVAAPDQPDSVASELSGKYMTFTLDGEEYGVGILKVRELIGLMDITQVPQMPDYVKGVINLRGKVIPVFDLRLRFGLEEAEYTDETCIIVVDVGSMVGIVVDTVQEVADIPGKDIEPPPPLGSTVDTTFLVGMGKVDGKVKILLDIDRILSTEDAARLSGVVAEI